MRLISAAETRPWTLRSKISTLIWLSDGGTGLWSIVLLPIARNGAQYGINILLFGTTFATG
jgi:hypothetical protein